ncbi:phosphatase PAP2 family protein [Robertkochia marina]|uniref:Phosphatase PAP2 family protein n=1 Tax=Robertkochia marina TaxID=1227945 RepID=A0A4S3LYG8_9FLAO|nr:phosphatase PAP2 family protein [Robertkochia marina]THD66335.1 phosphatase PAP2 family protein [Robertkochia marina]TRZ44018.1 phosphatase PAP2 family protein [Robertkochia marina]
MFEQFLEYDRDLLVYLNNLGIERYDVMWQTITKTAFWIPLYITFIYLIREAWKNKAPWIGQLTAVATLGFTMLLTVLVKLWVSRIRPSGEAEFSKLLRVLAESETYSFFSGHAANSFALTTVVVLLVQQRFPWAVLFFIWPLAFSFSRIYVGVHYPSDILVGTLVGLLIGMAGYRIHNMVRKKREPALPA